MVVKKTIQKISLRSDIPASIVVFLVALPLSLGISIASGVAPVKGLITAIVGGIVVGAFSGSNFQVSGPAAGLTVLVYEIVQQFGLEGLAVAVFLGGVLQLLAGILKLGAWFKAISPAVIYGMLAGIGLIIFSSQFHIMFDDVPKGSTIQNLLTIPIAIYKGFSNNGFDVATSHQQAALIGTISIIVIILWDKFKPKVLNIIPSALLAVIVATIITNILKLPIQRVDIPESLLDSINILHFNSFLLLKNIDFIQDIIGLAIIASAETLLCANAVDKMHQGDKTKYNQELAAQGAGNIICGFLGSLPMTAVIVRSTANVDAGAKSRISAILHGFWILIFVVSLPGLLRVIPLSCLAAILVYIGYKLINIQAIKKLASYGYSELIIYFSTVIGIITIDLLVGVVTGLLISLLKLIATISHVKMKLKQPENKNIIEVDLMGAATAITIPKISAFFEPLIQQGKNITVRLDGLLYIDHPCIDYFESLKDQLESKGLKLNIEDQQLKSKVHRVFIKG